MRKLSLSLLLALTLNACALFGSNDSQDSSRTTSKPSEGPSKVEEAPLPASSTSARKMVEGTEITWESPSEPVDGFVIRYGEDAKRLDKEVKLSVGDLKEEQDPEFGKVFRYVIRNVSPVKPLYVSIAAFKGDRLSDFSESKQEVRD
jgi:hypothetical protein